MFVINFIKYRFSLLLLRYYRVKLMDLKKLSADLREDKNYFLTVDYLDVLKEINRTRSKIEDLENALFPDDF